MEPVSWKNTLNYEFGYYKDVFEVVNTAAGLGYPFAAWTDGTVYTYSRDSKGVLIVEPTEYKVEDLG